MLNPRQTHRQGRPICAVRPGSAQPGHLADWPSEEPAPPGPAGSPRTSTGRSPRVGK
jgi:hypothetical protein